MAAFKGEREKERKKKKRSTGITNPGRSELESAGMADAEMASLKPWLFHVVKSPGPGMSKILGILHYFLNLKGAETCERKAREN